MEEIFKYARLELVDTPELFKEYFKQHSISKYNFSPENLRKYLEYLSNGVIYNEMVFELKKSFMQRYREPDVILKFNLNR